MKVKKAKEEEEEEEGSHTKKTLNISPQVSGKGQELAQS